MQSQREAPLNSRPQPRARGGHRGRHAIAKERESSFRNYEKRYSGLGVIVSRGDYQSQRAGNEARRAAWAAEPKMRSRQGRRRFSAEPVRFARTLNNALP